ncbi:MAG: inorganic diphosphatase [Limnochordia bacterium]|jgi:inorganic pyrophosphatase|nr:inorganic diphosphatase [Limnochordia bacterium]
MFHVVIEQTSAYENRMEYDPETQMFFATEFKSLFFARRCPYPYGWLKESGAPPGPHLDVILVSLGAYDLGSEVEVRIIGCFLRGDGDHKLVCVPLERLETDFPHLPVGAKDDLRRLYPRIGEGEGWFGADRAREIVERFCGTGVDQSCAE